MASTLTDREQAFEKHKYRWTDGTPCVNVTAISGLLDDGKSGAFAGAAVKMTRQGYNYRDEWDAKAERGNRIHAHCEAWLRGEDVDALSDEEGFLDGLELFMENSKPILLEQEEVVLSHWLYGGRFDMIVTMTDPFLGPQNWLIDLKTGKEYVVEHMLQLAAYRFADGMAVFDKDGTLDRIKPMPNIDVTACLYVNEDGSYRLVPYPVTDTTFAYFTQLLTMYQWVRTPEMKTLIKESKRPHD
jgi:hypothetical protein